MAEGYARLLRRFFRINLSNTDDRNAYYLVVEVLFAAILGSAATFNAAFALRLGAENYVIGLLSSIPALMAVLISIPSGWFLERLSKRTPWVFGSLLLYRAGFLVAAAVPWIHIPGVPPGLLLVLILVILTAPAYFFNVGWIPLLADVVSEERRSAVFSARNIINSITVSIFGFLFGLWLSWAGFPGNYQAMYFLGFLASMISLYLLFRLRVPDSRPATLAEGQQPIPRSVKGMFLAIREALTRHPQFSAMNRNTLLHSIGLWFASPLYVIFFVRELKAPDAWLGLNSTLSAIGTIVGYSVWRIIMARWGEDKTLKRTIVLLGLYPVIVGLMPSLPPILLLSVINGLVVPGVGLSHFNILLRTMPASARPTYTAIYVTLMNIGAFISPLIGVELANVVGIRPMLIVFGILSVIGSASFILWPVHQEPAAVAEKLETTTDASGTDITEEPHGPASP